MSGYFRSVRLPSCSLDVVGEERVRVRSLLFCQNSQYFRFYLRTFITYATVRRLASDF